jgi:hypothetical protein
MRGAWGLFGGNWEEIEHHHGYCGQISDPIESSIHEGLRAIPMMIRVCKNAPCRDYESKGRVFESRRAHHLT